MIIHYRVARRESVSLSHCHVHDSLESMDVPMSHNNGTRFPVAPLGSIGIGGGCVPEDGLTENIGVSHRPNPSLTSAIERNVACDMGCSKSFGVRLAQYSMKTYME